MTTVAEKLTIINGALGDIKTAIEGKGVTPSGDITTYSTAIGNISGGGSSGKYQLLDRVKDDSNNEIGTVSGFFTDANNNEYAVVCLDAQYRLGSGEYLSVNAAVSGIPNYQNQSVWGATETATTNTTAILATGTTSACTHCRSKSFTIDSVTYAGQLPTLKELVDIFGHRTAINTQDTSAGQYSALVIPTNNTAWSSSQYGTNEAWLLSNEGEVLYADKDGTGIIIPVLELPNA